MKDFASRIAVITGGGTGMGRELARQLAAEGCNVAMCDVSAKNMAETVAIIEADRPPQGTRVTTHVADVSDEVFNVASGTETSLLQLAEALLAAMGSDLHVEHGPERAVNGVSRRLADTAAAARDLGFVTEVGLADGLRELVEWWRPQREAIAAGRRLTGAGVGAS